MSEIKLKPCPFCGSKTAPEVLQLIDCLSVDELEGMAAENYLVVCNSGRSKGGGCGAGTGWGFETPEEAADAWNRRATRHAHWIKIDEDCRGYSSIFDCSGCGETTYLELPAKECDYDFCPGCGAEMVGGDSDA